METILIIIGVILIFILFFIWRIYRILAKFSEINSANQSELYLQAIRELLERTYNVISDVTGKQGDCTRDFIERINKKTKK